MPFSIGGFMEQTHRKFDLNNIDFSAEEVETIVKHVLDLDYRPAGWYDYSFIWSTDHTGNRHVFLQLGDHELAFQVEHTTLLSTMKDFRKAFGGDGIKDEQVIDKLARYDFHRALKYPLVAYYQKKIAELSRF